MTEKRKLISVLFANPNKMTSELVMQSLNRNQGIRVISGATTAQGVLDAVAGGG